MSSTTTDAQDGSAPGLPGLLGRSGPVHVAPMAGGPSRPELVVAAARADHFAQLAAGYKTATAMSEEIERVEAAGVDLFGVNLFAPNPHPICPADYDAYARSLQPTADRLGLADPWPGLREDDDHWDAKLHVLLDRPVPVVSFTFGLPGADAVAALRAAGSITLQTVTSPAEALRAQRAGVDALVVQGADAGGHSGVWDPGVVPARVPLPELVRRVRAATDLPLVAAGGIADRGDVRAALDAGAAAVAVGTAVLRTPEAGTSHVHRDALSDPRFTATRLTRAFTGRPARALVNRFVREHDGEAPVGYPALHHLTRPLRSAAAAAGDADAVHLWAGQGWRAARPAPAADVLAGLTPADR